MILAGSSFYGSVVFNISVNNNNVINGKFFLDQTFKSLEYNNEQIILVKNDSNPSVPPTSMPSVPVKPSPLARSWRSGTNIGVDDFKIPYTSAKLGLGKNNPSEGQGFFKRNNFNDPNSGGNDGDNGDGRYDYDLEWEKSGNFESSDTCPSQAETPSPDSFRDQQKKLTKKQKKQTEEDEDATNEKDKSNDGLQVREIVDRIHEDSGLEREAAKARRN